MSSLEAVAEQIKALDARIKLLEQQCLPRSGQSLGGQEDGGEGAVICVDGYHAESRAGGAAAGPAEEASHPIGDLESLHSLKTSVWDACLFVGHGDVGAAGSATLGLLVLLNLVIQWSFCWITTELFTTSNYGDAVTSDLLWWRTDAHLLKFEQEGLSLVERVCNQDPTLMIGTDKAERVAQIRAYHPQLTDAAFASGPVMVILALCMWYAILSEEIHDIIHFAMAMAHLPRGRGTVLRETDDGIALGTLSRGRAALAVGIVAVRLLVAGVLIYVGSLHTIYTTDLTGIILTAIELEFILNVDEMLFSGLAPKNIRVLFDALAPLPMRRAHTWKGLDCLTGLTMVLIPAGLACAYAFAIVPEMDHQFDAHNALCGGAQAFVHKDHFNLVVWTEGREYTQRDPARSALFAAAREIDGYLEGGGSGGRPLAHRLHSMTELGQFTSMDGQMLSSFLNYRCEDVLGRAPDAMSVPVDQLNHAEYLRISTGNRSISSCAGAARYCSSGSGRRVLVPTVHARRFCPQTCGCDHPGALLERSYCPDTCKVHDPYRLALEGKNCTDMGAEVLRGSATWLSLAEQQADELDRLEPAAARSEAEPANLALVPSAPLREALLAVRNSTLVEAHRLLMAEGGCGYLQLLYHVQQQLLMSGSTSLASPCTNSAYRFYCPVTCNCRGYFDDTCPPLCQTNESQSPS